MFGNPEPRILALRRIRNDRAAAHSALTRVRRAYRRGRHPGTAEDMLALIAVAEARLAFTEGQARLIERGDRQAILRVNDPVAYLEPLYDRAYARLSQDLPLSA